MPLSEEQVEALKDGKLTTLRLLGTKETVHVYVFKNDEAMRTAIRQLLPSKPANIKYSKDSVGLALSFKSAKEFIWLILLSGWSADIDTIAHEATHIVSFYYILKIKKYNLSNPRTQENFASMIGDLTQKLANIPRGA